MNLLVYISIFIFILGCSSENNIQENDFSELEFLELIDVHNFSNNIQVIDSLLLTTNFSENTEALLSFYKGKSLINLNKDKEALIELEKSLKIFKFNRDNKKEAEVLLAMGLANTYLDNREVATSQILEALEIAKGIEAAVLKANIYNSLARIHFLYGDYDSSIDYALQAIEIQKAELDTNGLSMTYNNLAVIYKNTGDIVNAINYNLKSLELNELLGNKGAIAKSYNNIGLNMELIGDTDLAIEKYKQAINLNKELERINTSPLRNLGALMLNLNRIEEAKVYYLEAISLEEKANKPKVQKDIYNVLLHLALITKDFENSLKYQNKRDSLYLLEVENENSEKIKLLENQYEFIVSQNDLKQAKMNNKKNLILFISAFSLLLLLVVSLVLFFRNNKLKLETEKIVLEQKVLRSQMNPHFIFNALSAIQNTLFENNPIKSASYLSKFAKLIRQNFDFIDQKTILLKDEIDALTNYMDTQNFRFKQPFEYHINLSNKVSDEIVEIPPLLLQPFVENSIEHGFKGSDRLGKIEINITKENDFICYEIIDNGAGFKTSLNKEFKTHAIDIFKKRLKLRGKKEHKTFKISSSSKGTIITFKLEV